MKLLLTTFFILISLGSAAQNFEQVDSKVSLYPKRFSSAEQLAAQIDHDFTTNTDKVRAIYTWLTTNVIYDLEKFYRGETKITFSYVNQDDLREKLRAVNTHAVSETLRTNKAVCEGYAQTFKKVSELLGIPCLFIGGYSKSSINDIGNIPSREDHAWNAVKINDKWRLIDATWGAGHSQNKKWIPYFDDYFFLTDPTEFALTHLPAEQGFLFIDKKVTVEEFYSAPLYSKAYFKNKLNLLKPLQGEITVKPNQDIVFEMSEISENVSLHYAYKENMVPKEIIPNCINSKCTFSISFTQNINTQLFIIANRETAIQYKVKVVK